MKHNRSSIAKGRTANWFSLKKKKHLHSQPLFLQWSPRWLTWPNLPKEAQVIHKHLSAPPLLSDVLKLNPGVICLAFLSLCIPLLQAFLGLPLFLLPLGFYLKASAGLTMLVSWCFFRVIFSPVPFSYFRQGFQWDPGQVCSRVLLSTYSFSV